MNDNDRDEHLAEIPDGCGCAGLWETLSEQRDHPDSEESDPPESA